MKDFIDILLKLFFSRRKIYLIPDAVL